jgi:hypothetical protein
MKIEKQKVILFVTKYLSYIINAVIIVAVGGFVAGWIYLLYESAVG